MLVRIDIPPSVRAIKWNAFCDCSGLTTAILNDGLEEIGKEAFGRCRALERIDIPPSVRAIKDCAFSDCSGLTPAVLNDGLEVIGMHAFGGCGLVRIDIPPSVRAIKNWAFFNCSGLTTFGVDDCDSQRRARGDWEGGIQRMRVGTHRRSPFREED